MSETNLFGGKNPNGQYVPLTEDEQETLERLATDHQFRIVIKDWGFVDQPQVTFGDARIQFRWTMFFDRPEEPMPVEFFDIEVWTHTGRMVYSTRKTTGPQALMVAAGLYLEMALDIQIKQINPDLVKEIKPGAKGLTTRHGNMQLDSLQRKVLHQLKQSEDYWARVDLAKLARVEKK